MKKNISNYKKRIITFLESQKITKRAFYSETGISNGTLDKNTGVSEPVLERFFKAYPFVNPSWVITGQGNMVLNSENGIVQEPEGEYGNADHTIEEMKKLLEEYRYLVDHLKTELEQCKNSKS
ncbi:hypothetical protein [Reichenbachiella versicolor]|uniref:hypothetical protein n=1 Tax=Reichenbachiella versicolor TaxID=1821036 RepID=UPI000D6DE619|nr:hypothetical protein [Reichenbachiella versicolor]